MAFRHFCITLCIIGAFVGVFSEDLTSFYCFIIALIVNGIYLIDERIKDLKK
jgi:hypothetical protein